MRVAIIGPGRMGQGLGLALTEAGAEVSLFGRRPASVEPPLVLRVGLPASLLRDADVTLIATPDDAISRAAQALADAKAVHAQQVVLHLSGLLGREALAPLQATGAALGSLHPLQTVADPRGASERLRGAYAGVEGDARAVAMAEMVARAVGLTPVPIAAASKPAYHAAAVMVANYSVVLGGIAEQIALEAGVPRELAGRIYLPLLAGALRNLEGLGPLQALTGPVRRGDVQTIAAHLAALAPEQRAVYARLGLAALELARAAGLEPAGADAVDALLRPALG